ncbi:MAG: phosphoglycerate mutase [Flavobacterium sp.]|nr:MAG: phosphoglycerate mutase [Flavobacterium sp.]
MIRALTFFLCGIILLGSCKNSETEEAKNSEETVLTTKYYLIRHAEKDRSDPENRDPALTAEGTSRANGWAAYFDTISLDAIYATKYVRTVMTATPTAEMKKLNVLPYNPADLYNDDFKNSTHNKTVLIVGHSNTTPAFVNKIIGEEKYGDMDDTDNNSLFVVTLRKDSTEVEIRTLN